MTNDYIETIHQKIETSRRELLDLGFRNPLLNYRLLRSRGLEVPTESSESIYRILVREEKSVSFLPTKESDEADALSQPDDEDTTESASSRRAENRIQTDLTSNDLQKRLLSTHYLANTLLQEQGVNTLFLALGMVEWYEAESSDIPRYSPLVLVPVGLERSNIRDRFHLSYTGEELGANLSFIEKVQTDFGTRIPQIPDDEDFELDAYFAEVTKVIDDFPRWSVDPGRIVLGFFSFSKFLMYRDLDPENWPPTSSISDNRLIQALFDGGFAEPEPQIDSDDHLDDHLEPEQIHHVVDADSSQALVIVDVNSGRNLVVQGPPGTGKSQTITNIIGEAIGQGKTVLFVSEKMAALEVVKRRLDSVGLGDACLELHSHKTTKKVVLDELSNTLDLKQPMLDGIEDDFDALTRLRNRLNAYSEAVNTSVANTGVDPYKAYGELVQMRERTKDVTFPRLDLNGMETWSPGDHRTKREVVEELQARLASTGIPVKHPFWGCRVGVMLPSDHDRLNADVTDAVHRLERFQGAILNLSQAMNLPIPNDVHELEKLNATADRVENAPNLRGVDLKSEEWIGRREDITDLLNAGAQLSNLHELYDEILTPNAWDADMREIRQALVSKGRKFWRVLSGDYRKAKAELAGFCRSSMPSKIETQLDFVDTILTSQQLRRSVEKYSELGSVLFDSQWRGEKSDWGTLSTTSSWVSDLHCAINEGKLYAEIIEVLDASKSEVHHGDLVQEVSEATQLYEEI
jgi:DNA polymerase III delta prime subunit